MTTYDFSPLFRSTIGFDRLADLVESAMRTESATPNAPAYNIERRGEDEYRITLAVAGFREEDLSIETREQALVVTGKRQLAENGVTFLHRGIADGEFRRVFQLADHVKVADAVLDSGLLHIRLVREIPEAMKPRRIDISAPSTDGKRIEKAKNAA